MDILKDPQLSDSQQARGTQLCQSAGNANGLPGGKESLPHFWHTGGGVANRHKGSLTRKKCGKVWRCLLLHAVTIGSGSHQV